MCGIVGIAGDLNTNHEKVFENMLVMDILRGKHSTGVVSVSSHTGESKIAKLAVNAVDFLESNLYSKLTTGFSKVLIGHNRFATIGKVNNLNAHPFDFENVVGVHNGTLSSRLDLHNQSMFDTDSESLYSHINEYGIKDAMQNCIGTYALVWWNKKDQTLNFLRNKDRTLFIGETDLGQIVWASEDWMVLGAAARNNLKIMRISLIPEDSWFSYSFDGKTLNPKPRVRKVEGKKSTPPAFNMGGYYRGGNVSVKASSNPACGVKGLVLRVTGIVDNQHSSHYVLTTVGGKVFSDKLRLYKTPYTDSLSLKIGSMVKGDATSFEHESGWVSIEIKSVTHHTADVIKLHHNGSVQGEPVTSAIEPVFKDHNGKYIPKSQWLTRYGTCSWCSSDIEPEDMTHNTTKGGDVLCGDCSADPEIRNFL